MKVDQFKNWAKDLHKMGFNIKLEPSCFIINVLDQWLKSSTTWPIKFDSSMMGCIAWFSVIFGPLSEARAKRVNIGIELRDPKYIILYHTDCRYYWWANHDRDEITIYNLNDPNLFDKIKSHIPQMGPSRYRKNAN